MLPKTNRRFLFIFIIAALLVLLHIWYYYPFIADDAFISFRYAERFLEEKGLTWTEGRPVEGYSNLLWVLLMASLYGLTHIEFWILALFSNTICVLITLWLLMKIMTRITDGNTVALIVSAGIYAASPSVAIWVNGGLEGPLVMVLLTAAIYFLSRDLLMKSALPAGICLGLLALTRPDGILFTWILTFALLIRIRRITKPLLYLNLIPLLFYGGQLIFRLYYYREWVPNTALVKVSFNWVRAGQGLEYVSNMLVFYSPLLLLAIVYCWKSKGKTWLVFFLIIIFSFCSYLITVGGDFFPGFRHGLPLVPLLCGIGGLVVMSGAKQLRLDSYSKTILSSLVIGGLFVTQFFSHFNSYVPTETWEWDARSIGQTLKTGFSPWKPSIAASCAGTLPYYLPFPALDMLGLNDYYLPRHPPKNFGYGSLAHELGDVNYFLRQSPDMFLLNGFGSYYQSRFEKETELLASPEFESQYQYTRIYCSLDYSLPFRTLCGLTKIERGGAAYPFIRIYSPRIGIRKMNGDYILVPVWFLVRRHHIDSVPTLSLDDRRQLVLKMPPGDTVFLAAKLLRPLTNPDSCQFTADNKVQLLQNPEGLEIINTGAKPVELKWIKAYRLTSR